MPAANDDNLRAQARELEREIAAVRKQLKHCVAGYTWLSFDGPVPAHLNAPELAVALGLAMPQRAELVPLSPPYVLRAEFRFALPADPDKWPGGAQPAGFHEEPPHLHELLSSLGDALALRGYLVDARGRVALDGGSEKRWADSGNPPGVRVYVRTLYSPRDRGAPIMPAPSEPQGEVCPAPWIVDADLEAVATVCVGSAAAATTTATTANTGAARARHPRSAGRQRGRRA